MRILGVDPGYATGWVACKMERQSSSIDLTQGLPADRIMAFGQRPLDDGFTDCFRRIIKENRIDMIVMESAVLSGRLNADKVNQLRAVDRLEMLARSLEIPLQEVTPEARRLIKKAPNSIPGAHTKDAYRVVVAYLLEINYGTGNP